MSAIPKRLDASSFLREAPPRPFHTTSHTSDEERRRLFRKFLGRFQARHDLTRAQVVASVGIRLGRTHTMVYHWLSDAERTRPIPFAMLDLLHYEELMVEDRFSFGGDILGMYENSGAATQGPGLYIPAEGENAPIQRPFYSCKETSDEERRLLFAPFMRRFEEKHQLTRPGAVTSIALRLGRTPTMVYHWLSNAARNRAIPFAMLDLLHYEELMVADKIDFGNDILAAYENSGELNPSPSVSNIVD